MRYILLLDKCPHCPLFHVPKFFIKATEPLQAVMRMLTDPQLVKLEPSVIVDKEMADTIIDTVKQEFGYNISIIDATLVPN